MSCFGMGLNPVFSLRYDASCEEPDDSLGGGARVDKCLGPLVFWDWVKLDTYSKHTSHVFLARA